MLDYFFVFIIECVVDLELLYDGVICCYDLMIDVLCGICFECDIEGY